MLTLLKFIFDCLMKLVLAVLVIVGGLVSILLGDFIGLLLYIIILILIAKSGEGKKK